MATNAEGFRTIGELVIPMAIHAVSSALGFEFLRLAAKRQDAEQPATGTSPASA